MKRKAISPFISTVILIAATFMIGGLLFTQFQGFVNRYVAQPSIDFTGVVVVPDSTSITTSFKNTGNLPIAVKEVQVFINGIKVAVTTRPPINSTTTLNLQPGKTATVEITSPQVIRIGDSLSLVVVSDQITKGYSFTVT